MSNKNLFILAIVAAVMVVWAVVQSGLSGKGSVESEGPTYLLQGLDPADIATIVIGKGDDPITLKRQGRGFVVANRANYPAKANEVNGLLTQILDLQTSGIYTSNPENFDDLGVVEDKAVNIVKFMKSDPNDPLLAGLIVGKTQEMGGGTYIRLLPGDNVYICSRSPYVPSSISSLFEQELIKAKKDEIESVTIKGPDSQYTLKKGEGSDKVVLENIPAGKKLKESDADTVFSALTSLRCDDIQKDTAGLEFNRQYVCKLKNSTVYTVSIAQKDGNTYVTCRAEYTGELPTKGAETESEEVLKEKEAKLLANEDVNKLNARHRGWVYKLTEWKAKSLTKPLADLLEDEKKEEKAEAGSTDVADVNDAAVDTGASAVEPNSVEAVEPNEVKAVEPNEVAVVPPEVAEANEPNAVKQ